MDPRRTKQQILQYKQTGQQDIRRLDGIGKMASEMEQAVIVYLEVVVDCGDEEDENEGRFKENLKFQNAVSLHLMGIGR
jgi:hypothetical protein